MAKKIQITLSDGKQQWVTVPEFNAKRATDYADAMVRMKDDEGNEYDVEKSSLNKAYKLGLTPFVYDDAPQKKTQPKQQSYKSPMSYQDINNPDYWSQKLGVEDTNPLPQPKAGLDIPNLGAKNAYVDRTFMAMESEANKYSDAEKRAVELQKQLAEAQKRAEAQKEEMAKSRTYSQTPYGLQAQIMPDTAASQKLAEEEKVIAKLSDELRRNEAYMQHLQRLGDTADELTQKANEDYWKREESKPWWARGGGFSPTPLVGSQMNDNRYAQAAAINKNIKETRKLLREASLNSDAFYNKVWRGFADSFSDLSTWDGGATELMNSLTTLRASIEDAKGVGSKGSKAVLESAAIKNDVASKTSNAISMWYNAGLTTGQMLPFAAQIYMSPLSGMGKVSQQIFANWARKQIESSLISKMMSQSLQTAMIKGMGGVGRFAGDVLGGTGTAAIFANQKIAADALNRYQGTHTGSLTPDGRFLYTGTQGGKSPWKSVLEAMATQGIEYQSELVGEYFTPLSKLIQKGLGKAVGYGTKETFDAVGNKIVHHTIGLPGHKISLDKTVNLLSRMTSEETLGAVRKGLRQAGYNGVIGEYLEEVVGNMENALLGINGANWGTGEGGVFNKKENLETLLAVAVGSGFMGGIGGAGGILHKAQINRDYKRANGEGLQNFGWQAWQSIKDQIDYAAVPELPNIILNLTEGMNERQKSIIQYYATRAVAKQGSMMADFKLELEKPKVAEVKRDMSQLDKFVLDSYDISGNRLASREFKSEEDMNLYENMVRAYIDNGKYLNHYNRLLSTDKGRDAAEAAAANLGYTLGEMSSIFYEDPITRSESVQNALDQFVQDTKDIAFPSNEVNTDQESQDGTDLADGSQLGDQQVIDTVNQREKNAIEQWNKVKTPDIESRINDLLSQDYSINDVADVLAYENYQESIIDAFCEMCNAGAFKDAFISKTGEKIQDEVAQQVHNNTFAGTLDTQKQPSTIIALQDEQGNTYSLIGGDINSEEVTDDAGNTTTLLTSDGLVILRDQNGELVQKPNLEGFTFIGSNSAEEYSAQLLQQMQEAVTAQIESTEAQDPEVQDPATPPAAPVQDQQNTTPVIPVDEKGQKLYSQAPVEDTVSDITNELGGDLDSAVTTVKAMADKAAKTLDDAQKNMNKPPKGNTPQEIILDLNERKSALANAQAEVDYWNNAYAHAAKILAEKDAPVNPPADTKPATASQNILDRWNGANKIDGNADEITIEDGSSISGHYILVESGAATPSHDPNTFYMSEGFPVDENGKTVNDRDYQNDKDAQTTVIQHSQNYDSRAIQNVPIVSDEGIVYSGNDRTMAGMLAAQNGTDTAYLNYLSKYASKFGFTPEQVASMQHPRVLFVADERMPYDANTFSRFNKSGLKNQNLTERAVKAGKIVQPTTIGQINTYLSGFDTLAQAYSDKKTAKLIIDSLIRDGVITSNDAVSMFNADGSLTGEGIDFVENVLLGNVVSEESVRILSTMKPTRQIIVRAIPAIVKNSKFEGYSIAQNIDNAIRLIANAKAAQANLYDYLRMQDAFEGMNKDRYSKVDAILARAMELGLTDFRDFMNRLNEKAEAYAYSNDMFEGEITLNDTINQLIETLSNKMDSLAQQKGKKSKEAYYTQQIIKLYDNETGQGQQPTDGQEDKGTDGTGQTDDGTGGPQRDNGQQPGEEQQPDITEADIDADEIADDNAKELAKDFLRGENTGTIAELFYREIAARARAKKGKKPDTKKPAEPSQPVEDTAPTTPAENPPADNTPASPADNTPAQPATVPGSSASGQTQAPTNEGKKSDTQQAFDEFRNVMERFRNAGRGEMSVSLVGLNSKQIEMLADVFRATAKLGYAMIKDGATAFSDWLERMRAMVGETIKANSKWNDQDITDLLTETWNNKYLVDGVRKPLSQWAAEEALAAEENNPPAQPATVPDSSAVGQTQPPFTREQLEAMTKQQMIDVMWHDVFPTLCEMYKVPSDVLDENAYWFAPKMTTGYPKDSLVDACMKYMEHLNDDVAPASEKQMNYIMKLAAEDEKRLFKDITLTKTAASRVIDLLKQEENMIYGKSGSAEDFEEIAKELEKIARLNGADLSQKDQKQAERKFVDDVAAALTKAMETGEKPYASIASLRKAAREAGMEVDGWGKDDIKIQELVEDALVRTARGIMEVAHVLQVANRENNKFSQDVFEKIKLLYNLQPTISMRSSNRVALQQYSTPLPMAFCADMFATRTKAPMFFSAFEPTAGNGMLVFAIPSTQVHVNEIDEDRLENLRGQDFKSVTTQDATQPFTEGSYNAVITNPPFGEMEAKDYDGYKISGLAPQIALNAIERMKDNGRAVIIIGGNQKFASNGAIQNDKPFLTYLYNHYNVKGVIDMDGSLYAKQGTTFPTRMILIDGRRTDEERAKSDVYPPTIKDWLPKADSFDKLYETVNNIINSNEKTNGTEIVRTGKQPLQSDSSIDETGTGDNGTNSRKPVQDVSSTGEGDGTNGGSGKGSKRGSTNQSPSGSEQLNGSSGLSNTEPGDNGRPTGGDNGQGREGVDYGTFVVDSVSRVPGTAAHGVGLNQEQEKRKLESEKLDYRPHNGAFSLESVAPAAMVEAMDKALKRIEEEFGNIDDFVTNELGYDSVDEMHKALAAEQVDSVAMAIYNMKKGQALIIGDQTGVGKGRQMAALIRWAVRQGKKPVFMTQKSNLFNDIYRDLKDVGSENLKPFIFNTDKDAKITEVYEDENGEEQQKIIYRSATEDDIKTAVKNGKIPDDCDFVLCTYSQVSTGDSVSREYEDQLNAQETDGNKKRARSRRQPKPGAKPRADVKASLLRTLAKDNYLMLDESHTAAGESNQGYYMQTLVRDSKAVTFASATYAKRPDTMPLYAMRTSMSKANIGMRELIGAIQKGGVTLQEIMSRALTDSGQMVRRERDMNGVVTDWTTIDDPETVKKARENYDRTIQAFNAIIDFQNTYFEAYLESQRESLAVMAGNAGYVRGTEKMGISNTPFASKTYNYTKQLMLALKVDAIVDEVEKQIKAGRKPVIALDNTMGSMISDLAVGEELEETTFAASLLRGLESIMQYTQKDGTGGSFKIKIQPHELGPEGEAAYYQLVSFIKESTKDVFISPLDEIINKLHAKGYKVGELTGRENVVVEKNGKYYVAKRGNVSKQLLQSRFNNNKLDCLIINKTGSTGISLHASKTFADQRQRVMILAQPLPDINDYMQMIGRIDRTGQVQRGYYINLGLPVPAEQRFLMMLSTKLKSLNANTTTSQDSKDNNVDAPDMLNKYGSQVIVEYFKDHPDIYNKLGTDPLKVANSDGGLSEYKPKPDDSDARKLTGHVALLSTEEQQAFYDDVVERYNSLIKYLNDSGTNDLKITSLPLNAKTLGRAITSKGSDPEGNNPFAKNAYCEMVEMDVIRKPMKAKDIKATIVNIAKNKVPGRAIDEIKARYQAEHNERVEKQKRKYEAELERNKENLAKFEDKVNSNEKMSEEEKVRVIEDKRKSLQETTDNKNQNALDSLDIQLERMFKTLDMFKVGEPYLVPDNLDVMTFELASPAIFMGYKAKENGITPSSTVAVFATLDGRRRVEVKLSELNKLRNISETTSQNYDAAQEVTLDNWDENTPNQTRKTGYIMTGNILQAIKDTQDENGAFPGQLVSYTDSEGNIHDGILMPDKWQPSMMINAGKPISEMEKFILDGNSVISTDGEVEINVDRDRYMGDSYVLRVPRSKKTGSKYWENRELLEAINGKVFYQSAGKFQVYIPKGKLKDVLTVLDKLGVKVATDFNNEFAASADSTNRLAYSSSTNNVNNSRIIPEDVDKSVSLQIENEFDSAIESLNLTEEEKKELDKKIEQYSNSSTIDLEDTFYLNNSKLRIRDEKKNNFSEMLWRRGSAVSSPTTNAGGNIRDEKGGAESLSAANGQSAPMVSQRDGETEGADTTGSNEVQGQNNGPRDIRNTGADRLFLHEGRRIEEKVVSQTPRTQLSSYQRRLLAEQYAISRELVYREIRLAALQQSLGLQEGKPTSLDDIAAAFEKTNTDKQVKALFDKILAVNKRLGTSIEVAASDVNNNSGSAGTRRDVHYYLDGFTRTSAGKIQVPVVLAHELLHQGTIGAINLVRKNKAEGVLTKEQIDAVNTIIDIYNKVKANPQKLSESQRGLADPYEFAAQMVDPRQRKALSMSPLQRIMAAANELKAKGDTSLWNRIKNAIKTLFGLSDLKKMDNAINTLLDTFNETVHDISMTDADQNGWGYFIGEKGARNMDKAEEANIRLDNLKAARQFEAMGKDPKTIKWATGWERGADGKWRYEIPDLKFKHNYELNRKNANTTVIGREFSLPFAKLSDVIDAKELFDAYPQLKNIKLTVYKGEDSYIAAYYPTFNTIAFSSNTDTFEPVYSPVENWDEINKYILEQKKLLDKLSDNEKDEYYDAVDMFGGLTEDELANEKGWKELEKEMPTVAELVRLFNKKPKKIGGERIGMRFKNNDYVRGIISHEIQHAIQEIEKFASGGDMKDAKNETLEQLQKERKQIEDSLDEELNDLGDDLDGLLEFRNKLYGEKNILIRDDDGSEEMSDKIKNVNNKIYHIEELISDVKQKMDNIRKGQNPKLSDIDKKIRKEKFGMYKRGAGETEARNVQARIGMTPEQRSRSLASETEDVAREDQIFFYDNMRKSEMRSGDLFDKYPTWLSGQTTGTGQHTTQITSTVNTYKKIGDWMKSQGMEGASVLDASSGLGKGTEALKEMGFNVEDVEPYPSENRTAPTYLKYEDIKGKYDVVISNAVLNVIPDDWRADVLKNMADKVKPGGKMIINVRDAKEMEKQKQKIELDSPSEILVTDKAGNIRAYQKGFTQKELADWVQSELGEGWQVETAKPSNSGISGRAVVVTRNSDAPLLYRKIETNESTTRVSAESQSKMKAHAQEVASSLNTQVTFVTADQVPASEKSSKGFYNTKTGEVVIVLDNNTSTHDIEQTIVHEVVGHKGLRGLLGSKGLYTLLDSIYNNMSDSQKKDIQERARRNGWRLYTAVEEYLAEQAENTVWDSDSASLWQNIKHYITEALRNIGFRLFPNLKDARYWIWLSQNQLRKGDVMSSIKRNALLDKLDRMKAPPVQTEGTIIEPEKLLRSADYVQYATYNNIEDRLKQKTFYWNEAYADHMASYKIFQEEMEKGLEKGLQDNMNAYELENQSSSAIAQRQYNFIHHELHDLQKEIKGLWAEFGKGQEGLDNLENYLMEKHGLERNRVLHMRDWYKSESSRHITSSSELSATAQNYYSQMESGIWQDYYDGKIDEKQRDQRLKEALYEAHMRYLDETMEDFRDVMNTQLDNYENGFIPLSQAYGEIDNFINQHSIFDPNKKDKSGLTALKHLFSGLKYEDDKVIQDVENWDKALGDKAHRLMSRLQDVTQFALFEDYKNGIVTKEGYERARNMFRYYIPLRGYDDTTMEDIYQYMTNTKGTGVKSLVHAKGRKTKADSPIATAAHMALKSIQRGQENQVKLAAYRMVNQWQKDNPDDVPPATVVNLWTVLDATGDFVIKTPAITDSMTAEEIRDAVGNFEETMKALERVGKAQKLKSPADFRHKFESKNHQNEHIVPLMINGRARAIVFNGNPRPAMALRGDLAPKRSNEFGMDRITSEFNRIMSGMFTSYNPSFMVTNLFRDTLFSNNNVAINEGIEYYGKFAKNQALLLTKDIGRYAKLKWDYDNGIPPRNEMEQYFYEFMENGGKTGFVDQYNIAKIKKHLEVGNKSKPVLRSGVEAINMIPQAIRAANERLENINRFACYMTSRQMGRSVTRSVRDAKEVSVNFNRRGAGSNTAKLAGDSTSAKWAGNTAQFCRGAYLFFNAGVQSLALFTRNFKKHPVKTSAFAVGIPLAVGGFIIPMLNQILAEAFGDGDDPYANLPQWERRNNICIYIGNGAFLKFPLPIELRAFYGLGDIAAGYLVNEHLKSLDNPGYDVASQLTQILPIDFLGEGGDLAAAFTPDAIKPMVQIATNKDWTGKPIWKENEWNKYAPEYKKAFSGEFEPFVNLSKLINESLGGTANTRSKYEGKWNNPAIWHAIMQGYGGGAVMDLVRLGNLGKKVFTRESVKANEIPIIKSVLTTPSEKTKYYRFLNKYYKYKEEAEQFEYNLKQWMRSSDPLEHSLFLNHTDQNNPSPEYRRMEWVNSFKGREKQINQYINSPEVPEAMKETAQEELNRERVKLVNKLDQIK